MTLTTPELVERIEAGDKWLPQVRRGLARVSGAQRDGENCAQVRSNKSSPQSPSPEAAAMTDRVQPNTPGAAAMDKQDQLAEVIRKAIIACGAAREADLANPIAAAVRSFMGSDEAVREALSDSQSTLSAIKAECLARVEQEEDQMAERIADMCLLTMISNIAALGGHTEYSAGVGGE